MLASYLGNVEKEIVFVSSHTTCIPFPPPTEGTLFLPIMLLFSLVPGHMEGKHCFMFVFFVCFVLFFCFSFFLFMALVQSLTKYMNFNSEF